MDAYSEGRIAGREGQPDSANPYPPGSAEHTQWALGWAEGARQ